jgi:hypothetical protein
MLVLTVLLNHGRIEMFVARPRSFENNVLPAAYQRGTAGLRMKSIGGSGETISNGAFTLSESLSYAMSLPVATTISGIDSMEVLDQNLAIPRDFKPLSADRCRRSATTANNSTMVETNSTKAH